VGLDEDRSLQKKGGYTNRVARSHFAAAVRKKKKKREGKLRGKTRALHTQDAICTAVDGGFLKHLL